MRRFSAPETTAWKTSVVLIVVERAKRSERIPNALVLPITMLDVSKITEFCKLFCRHPRSRPGMLCDEAYAAATVLRQHYFLGARRDGSVSAIQPLTLPYCTSRLNTHILD